MKSLWLKIVFFLIAVALYFLKGLHVVEEGNIGIYFQGNYLLDIWTKPGLHYMHHSKRMKQVSITLKTHNITSIPCGTQNGFIFMFGSVEVVYRLNKTLAFQTIKNYSMEYGQKWISQRVYHSINTFCLAYNLNQIADNLNKLAYNMKYNMEQACTIWAPGIEIIEVRIPISGISKIVWDKQEAQEIERVQHKIHNYEYSIKSLPNKTQKLLQKLQTQFQNNLTQITEHYSMIEKQVENKISEIDKIIQTLSDQFIKHRQQKAIKVDEQPHLHAQYQD